MNMLIEQKSKMNSIINKAFGKKETLTEEEFVDVIDNKVVIFWF